MRMSTTYRRDIYYLSVQHLLHNRFEYVNEHISDNRPHLHRADLRCATYMRNNNTFTRKNSSLAALRHCFRTRMGFFDTIVPKPPLPDDSIPGGRYTHRLAPHTADAQPTFATSSLFGNNVKRISSPARR
ncbi:unnamed protein product, partial [Mesorhabditis spiculigera]